MRTLLLVGISSLLLGSPAMSATGAKTDPTQSAVANVCATSRAIEVFRVDVGGGKGLAPSAQGPITGTLGGVAIGGMTGDDPTDVIEFKFLSDTSDVTPFTAGNVHGWENLTGTATITVRDFQTSAIVAQGTFLPSDDIFVSIDNVNGGIGFGSGGSSFPGNPAYPFGIAQTNDPAINTYDLQIFHVFISSNSLSCFGFPGACATPPALATTAGDLIFGAAGNQFDPADIGEFAANPFTVPPPAPVPEPGTWALMAIGLAELGFMRRKALRVASPTA
jgi:PEP-CTERM motif